MMTFEERFRYLMMRGRVSEETFGCERILNQTLYSSKDWKRVRLEVIERDYGNDLGVHNLPIHGPIYIHHINPLTPEIIQAKADCIFDPDNLICCSFSTHNAIHYGDMSYVTNKEPIIRTPNDMIPYRR